MSFHSLNLEELRGQEPLAPRKTPFEHQLDAFDALNRTFALADCTGVGALLVLPTGGGKTFTTVKWLCDEAVRRNHKILWLAHSFYLLDQAFHEFQCYARWISEPRQILNIRVVSSNPSHDSASSIALTDDVVIMTTQTAIKNLHAEATDENGQRVGSNFRRFIESGEQSGLLVVLDEAHHAPAYGCRHLLIGQDEAAPGIRRLVPRTNLLGLTATPTYSDEARRGWLGKIFEAGVVYQADKAHLTAQGILARPNYIPRPTGKELVVSESLYGRLVREHQDLPEDIIEKLAGDSGRNDYIVQEYVRHRDHYGKTIIFADRWFQCIYLKEKLLANGVRADAIYSRVEADPGSLEAHKKRAAGDNERILHEFKHGKDEFGNDKLDVLINVRMLTEGADVPSVRTVFLTRQTTSTILMAQMIGRALRGKKAGGGDEANIVLFMDEWKRLIDWATPAMLDGGLGGERVVRGHYPHEYISIRLIEELARRINSGGEYAGPPFSRIVPIGWYQTEFVVAVEDGSEETRPVVEYVMVYDDTKPRFDAFIKHFHQQIPKGWDNEALSQDWMRTAVEPWMTCFFAGGADEIGNSLVTDLARIARHIAQRQAVPEYHSFDDRAAYDLDALAARRLSKSSLENDEYLRCEFGKPGTLWRVFYKNYDRFTMAFDGAIRRRIEEQRFGKMQLPPEPRPEPKRRRRELSDAEKKQVLLRDGNICLCCGAGGRGVRLQVDPIISYSLGGDSTIENSQTLCSVCNREPKLNELNFRQTATLLPAPCEFELLARSYNADTAQALTRLVNYFYHCRAVAQVHMHTRSSGRFYATWEVELFGGNDPRWLRQHERALLAHIHDDLGCAHVKGIKIRGAQ